MDILSFLSHWNLFPSGPTTFLASNFGSLSYASLQLTSQLVIRNQSGTDVTAGTTFSVFSGSGFTVSAGGLVTSTANGSGTIRATNGALHVDIPVTVQQVVASISGVSGTLSTNDTSSGSFTPVAKDANNNTVSGATFAYSSDQPSILSVNASTGAWAGQSAGTAHVTITASPGGATFTVTATVTHVTYTLTVTPNPITGSSGGTVQLTVMEDTGSGPVDVTADSGTVYSIADTSKATVDVPTLTSISPNTITQGTNASYTFTGTNIKGNETIGGLPTGVTASNYSYTSTTVVCTLTATGSATTGGASLTLVASGRGTSGAQTLTVNVGGGVAPSVGTSVAPALYVHMDYGISLNGSTIASIKDQSANGYSFTQATAAAQPSYVTNAYNGHACARFTAAQYLVSTALLTALQSANFSIMVIGTCVDTSGSGIRRAFMNHGSSTGFGIGEDSAFRWCVVSETFSNPLGIAAGNSALHALIYTGDAPGNNTGYSDSTTGASMGASTRAINTTDAAAIGGTNTGTNLWKGDIACIIAWPSVLSSADIAAAISFARTQFGTP